MEQAPPDMDTIPIRRPALGPPIKTPWLEMNKSSKSVTRMMRCLSKNAA